ncbi:MAG TPA: AraC family transcriptional regulator [Rhodocyclaceae bacterium]|nr:AraC family transcriptional regulator [Rhodocyclaceae bacterium]
MPTSLHPPVDRSARYVAGAYLQPLLATAAARGVAAPELARAAGLDALALTPLPETLPAEGYLRLLEVGAALADDPHFGLHIGEHVKLGAYNVYGLILLSCENFAQVLQQTMRYEGLAHDLGRSSLCVHGDIAEYQWRSNFPDATRHLAESVFAGMRVFANWLAGAEPPAASVAFMHAASADRSEHERIFGPAVEFGATAHSARFDASFLERPVPNADIGLYPVLQGHAERLLREKQRNAGVDGVVALVRAAIVKHLSQDGAHLATIAQQLNMTPRTLQRKLKEAGVSFQQLLDATRHELARDYLSRGDLNLTEIAFLLGYQEQSSFNHAFKEWSGVNPGAYRDKRAANGRY